MFFLELRRLIVVNNTAIAETIVTVFSVMVVGTVVINFHKKNETGCLHIEPIWRSFRQMAPPVKHSIYLPE